MAELKTQPTGQDVDRFLESIVDAQQRQDCRAITELMRDVTGAEPRMWGEKIVGFGHHHYRYASGREGDWFLTGFAPRKQNLTLYLSYGFDQDGALLQRLGKHKVGKACLYIKRLADVDQATLRELVQRAVEQQISG
jgi:Domain of unknown function (DU1801)